ncbi:hypothetical protein Zmor_027849 [Zophobas morio]|uniref:Phorbol-ester/DAG-type domain-containing protein n=1 Tax=Zophobas morio TaxID=2755281 RepID=A0AA38HRS1_9CUCU|nr:hypothetical protein Zmor_027849 [Zophobas morio]
MADTGNIVLCKKCLRKVVNSVKCQKCAQQFHPSCAKTSGKFCEDGNFVCCDLHDDLASTPDSDFWDAMDDLSQQPNTGIDARIFMYIIRQKDRIIEEQCQQINLLKAQISNLIPSSGVHTKTSIDMGKTVVDKNDHHVNKTRHKKSTVNNINNVKIHNDNNEISIAAIGKDTHHTKDQNNDTDKREDNDWKTITPKKRKLQGKKSVVGCSDSSLSIQAIPRMGYVHVYRLCPNTTAEQLQQHLVPKVSVINIEKLNSKHPEIYASFKLTVDLNDVNAAMDPKIWPTGTRINRFFHLTVKKRVAN